MDEQKSNKTGIIIVLIIIVSIWFSKGSKIKELNYRIEDYKDASAEANRNIEEARSYAWGSYDDMGYALENLEIAEVIPSPYDDD